MRKLVAGRSGLAAAIAIALAALSLAQPAFAARHQAPGSIASDCSRDVTQQVLSWIASVPDNSTLSFARGGCYRIEGTLELTDRNGLTFEGNGATFKATTIGDTWRSQWRLIGGSRIAFRNMNVQGAHPAGGTFVSALQHQHAFDLNGVSHVELDRTRSSNLYGDCVYITRRADGRQAWSSNVHVHDSSCIGNGRMGIAVVAGCEVLVERTNMSQIGRTAFDVEPNGPGFGAQNVTFRNNRVSGALPGGFFTAIGDGLIDSVTVSDNSTSGVGIYMAVLALPGQRRSQITISGNSSDTGYYAAGSVAMDFERVDGLTVTGNSIPLSGPNMALAWVSRSCDVKISGNSFPGGVAEARISSYSSCTTRSTATTRLPPSAPAPNQPPTVLPAAPVAGTSGGAFATVKRRAATSTTLRVGSCKTKASSNRRSAPTHARGRVKGARSGRVVLRLEHFDGRAETWVKARTRRLRVSRRGRFGARLRGLAGGLWRARATFKGTRRGAPSASPYRYFRIS